MSERGHYGKNGVSRGPFMGANPSTIYVERAPTSTGAWIIGILATGGAVLWARHQTKQIEQLYKTSGMPYQSFAGSLGQSARSIPSRVRGLVGKKPAAVAAPEAPEAAPVDHPTHSTRSRARAR